jgi:DNA mismatch repair protein MutL
MTDPATPRRRVAVLPDHLANKIAAGEVIQRPDSVVKELVENSLDAGASSLQVVVRDGGKEYIQVTDNGIGMDEQDAVLSFLRHATSKIATYDELEAIRTYGFRGEALASIAAVAQVTMKTRRAEDDMAVIVKAAGEAKPVVSRDAHPQGTTVIVQNLFFNVPARRKFLKSTNTEFRHIFDVIQRTAVAHPELAIEFMSDGEVVFRLKPSSLDERLIEVFGQRACESLITLQETTDFLGVSGFIGKPQFGQKSRSGQYLFLNGRFIVSRNVSHAVHSAYEHLLAKGSFPFFLLFLEIDPHRIDVNVHPSKMEAKFDDEQGVHRFIASLARKALGAAGAVPALTASGGIDSADIGFRFTSRQHAWAPMDGPTRSPWEFPSRESVDPLTGEIASRAERPAMSQSEMLFGPAPSGSPAAAQPARPAVAADDGASHLLWQLHDRYIFSQIRNGVMIVDQHVAHERILYERALEMFDKGMRSSQQLLFPCTIEMTPGDFALFEDLMTHFDALGFDAKPFGRHAVLVEGVPVDVKPGHEQHILQEMLEQYKEYQQHAPTDVRDNMAKAYACRSAIKAGDPLTEQEMRSLIDQLFATSMPYVCPHGRPVVLRISTEELDRRFGRR